MCPPPPLHAFAPLNSCSISKLRVASRRLSCTLLIPLLLVVGCEAETDLLDPTNPSPDPSANQIYPSLGEAPANGYEIIPDDYIVVYRDGAVSDPTSRTAALLADSDAEVRRVFHHIFTGFSGTIPDAQTVTRVDEAPDVLWVIPNRVIFDVAAEPSAVPLFSGHHSDHWNHWRINQRKWPFDQHFEPFAAGTGVRMYIVDSGIWSDHDEFQPGRVQTGSFFDEYQDGQDGEDCNGHGTRVAGVAGGNTYSVAPETLLHSVRVLNCQGTLVNSSFLLEGLEWIADEHPSVDPAVINISLQVPHWTVSDSILTLLENATDSLVDNVGPVIGAAGNDGADACNYFPASAAAAITVAASTIDDEPWAPFHLPTASNYGACVDLFAPGAGIETAGYDDTGSDTSKDTVVSATSYAAPLVSGIAAIYLEDNPLSSGSQVSDFIIDMATEGELTLTSPYDQTANLLAFTPRIPSASIDGPWAPRATTHTWHSNPDGGDFEQYEFIWERQFHYSWGDGPWVQVGTSEQVQLLVSDQEPDFTLQVTVESAGAEGSDDMFVISPCNKAGTCP